jgi:hypothetical protein
MTADAREITRALGGRWHGSYGVCKCPAHEDRSPSLSVSDGQDGRLLLRCFAGCDFGRILDALRGMGIVAGAHVGHAPDPAREAERRRREAEDEERRRVQARSCWGEAVPIGGTVAETYLRTRGITAALPATLRFHPACWHATGKRLPAMIALVEGQDGFGVHRTYLRADGGGKAAVEPAKAMLGPVKGGAVRLTDAGPGAPLVVAEGIETALSLASGMLNAPATIWAALSTTGMAALRLPLRSGRITAACDGDPAGRSAADALLRRAKAAGWRPYILAAPPGQDWNDVLLAEREAAS